MVRSYSRLEAVLQAPNNGNKIQLDHYAKKSSSLVESCSTITLANNFKKCKERTIAPTGCENSPQEDVRHRMCGPSGNPVQFFASHVMFIKILELSMKKSAIMKKMVNRLKWSSHHVATLQLKVFSGSEKQTAMI